jgi:RimJ/RimL family protein N-acetyltransferase
VLSGPPAGLVVAELGPDDWQLFRRVRLAALADSPAAFGSRHADWMVAEPGRWRARLTDVPLNLVLIMDGEPVGMVSGTAPLDGTVELISLWVAPTARGRGVPDEAVRRVRDWARSQKAARLVLSVKIANTAARRLYERLGFELVGPSADDPRELVLALELSRC